MASNANKTTNLSEEDIRFYNSCGEFKDYERHILYYNNGDIKYIGTMKDGRLHGKGRLYKKGHITLVEGYFRDGIFLGKVNADANDLGILMNIEAFDSIPEGNLEPDVDDITVVEDVEEYIKKYSKKDIVL